jgi:hypothetical protein
MTINTNTNTLAGFTFPVVDGTDVYQFDEIRCLVDDHADGSTFVEGDETDGFTIRVRQQGINPSIGFGWTWDEAWLDAAKEILNGADGNGYSNGDSWDDLKSATEYLESLDADDEYRPIFESRIATLIAAGATL